MEHMAQIKQQTHQAPSTFTHRICLLQRKCACGGSPGIDGICEQCRSQRLSLQQSSLNLAELSRLTPLGRNGLHASRQPLNATMHSLVEPRFGRDFDRVRVNSTMPRSIQAKLTISQPGDRYEQEADQVAEQVMRMPVSDAVQNTGSADPPSPLHIQQPSLQSEKVHRQPEEEVLQAKESLDHTSTITPELQSHIHTLEGGGQSLPEATRAFMEPRFGYDFSHVRVHTDARAAESAQAVNALAYTIGHDIVFGPGEYAPATVEGKRLLAHELVHVIQQESRLVSRHVQRASIPYRQITWNDFKGSIPADPPYGAETASGFAFPQWRTKNDIKDTKEVCEANKKKTTIYTAKLWVDPKVYDNVQAYMEQGRSWALPKYKNPEKHCDGVMAQCKKEIGEQAAEARKECRQWVKPCQEAFAMGLTRYSVKVGDTQIVVSNEGECSTKLVSDCEQAMAKRYLFESKDHHTTVAKATTEAECSSPNFKKACTEHYKDWSPHILKHEQGHFDISNVMANKARADLKAMAAQFSASATACGQAQAKSEAEGNFKALNADNVLSQRGQEWIDLKNRAEKDYDDQTEHGIKRDKQKIWENDIAGGLKKYDLKKPAAPARAPATPAKRR